MNDLLTTEVLRELNAVQETPKLTLYMPTERRGMNSDGNAIRFKNLLREAEGQLAALGMKQREIAEYLEPLWHLHEDKLFWMHQSEGFVCFRAPGFVRYFRLPVPFHELLTVNRRFHLKPLLKLLSMDAHFYVLALSEQMCRLLYCTRYGARVLEVSDLPPNMDYTLRFDDPEKSLQQHTTGGGPASVGRLAEAWHGHGANKDVQLSHRLRYFKDIDNALHKVFRKERAPLILATLPEEHALFRQVSEYPHVAEALIPGNPELVSDQDLHERAWPLVEPIMARCRNDALALLEQGLAHEQGVTELADALRAAHDGLVDHCFVPVDRHVWGSYDPETREVTVHTHREPNDDDLLDLAALKVLSMGGVVWAVEGDEMPFDANIAVSLRYAVPKEVVHQG